MDELPDAPATADRRQDALKKFFDSTMALANQRITEGRYVDAETVVKVVLRPEYDPGYKPAITLLKHLEDPEYYNRTVTPGFIDKVNQVKALFVEAQGFYDTARYDLAYKRYEQILAIDPYNDAARKGQERVDLARAKHYDPVSYDHTRGHMLADVGPRLGPARAPARGPTPTAARTSARSATPRARPPSPASSRASSSRTSSSARRPWPMPWSFCVRKAAASTPTPTRTRGA